MPEQRNADREIFAGAMECATPEERVAYLASACGGDAELRARVEALLQAHERAGRFLVEGDQSAVAPIEPVIPVHEGPGSRIGRYKLLEQIGEGGFGVVYMAEQEEPVRRRVALKIIKIGMDTRSVVARFEAERQALAMMEHPNIAKVLDGGATDLGRPYFVMELVRGVPITQFCDQNRLTTQQRLDLFVQVCAAVQHAHQKGVIHRDLKPSNVLVTLHDDRAVPKIIDFGIAKATEHRLTEKTLFTRFHQFIGTPAYMSPEQTGISGLDVDTRSDIYSLGVLLYELLTGRTPFDTQALLKAGYDEIQRTIREKEPLSMSARLAALNPNELTTTAQRRRVEPVRLTRELRGDLDWIVMKCLEKDRTRRYETANGLAADIQRHLKQEPVVARPPSAAYRFQKLVRRNKLSVAAGSAVAAALIAGLAVSLVALARERAANARAEQRMAAALKQVESVLTNDLPAVRRLAGSTRASESMLRNTLSFMSALAPNAADNPEFLLGSARVHASLAMLQGNRYFVSLGDPETALASASNAWTLLRSIPTGALPRVRVQEMTFRAEQASGMALQALGREDEALAHYERMLTLATGLDQQLPRTGDCRWTSEAHAHLGAYFMAKGKWEQSREHYDHRLRDPYLLTNTASEDLSRLNFTGSALWVRAYYYRFGVSNLNMALDYFRQSLSFSEAHLKQASSDQTAEFGAVLSLVHIGMILCEQRNHAEGLPIVDEALRRMESLAAGDKANWNFQDVLAEFLRAHAERRVAAARAGEFSSAERLSFLEQARTSYQRCLEWMNASAANSRQRSWVDKGADDVKRELEEVEAAIATLKGK
jgi:serine/threonine protein kinase